MEAEGFDQVLEDWELLSNESSARAEAGIGTSQQLGQLYGAGESPATPGSSSQGDHEAEGLVELFLEAGDSNIQPTELPLQPFFSGQLSASSEASVEAADCAWATNYPGTAAEPQTSSGAAAGDVESLASAPRSAQGSYGNGCDVVADTHSSAADSDSVCGCSKGWEALVEPPTPVAAAKVPGSGAAGGSGSTVSLADSVHSMGSVQLKLVRADEHRALQATLRSLERRAGLRERQLAEARARLADSARECSVLRRVAFAACSLCALFGLKAILGPGLVQPTGLPRSLKAHGKLQLCDDDEFIPQYSIICDTLQVRHSPLPLARMAGSALLSAQLSKCTVELEPLQPATP
ncbi:hypothetical protein N2152v2_003618 [Parachlorella kessleri]